MNLLNLAPDIQEEILFLPKTLSGRDVAPEQRMREIASIVVRIGMLSGSPLFQFLSSPGPQLPSGGFAFLGIAEGAMDASSEHGSAGGRDNSEHVSEDALPKIAGRNDNDERLALIIWPPSLSCARRNGPIDPELLYRNCRAHAEETFAQRYDNWEENSKQNPTRGHLTEIRADALIAADLTTCCCIFMCEVLEYHADYLLDSGNTVGEALRRFDQFANVLVDETQGDKWRPGVQSVNLCEEDIADAFWRAARETVFRVRGNFGRVVWRAERRRTDEALYGPPFNEPPHSVGQDEEETDSSPLKLRAARDHAKLSRPAAAKLLKRQKIQITADAIKKHEEGKAKPRPAVRKAYAAIYNTSESALFPE